MLNVFMDILGWVLKILTGYTAIMGVCFLLPRRKKPITEANTRFAVLIPARNEENVVESIIRSLQDQNYPRALFDIIVLPNNCTDDTQAVALQAGAKVLNCTDPVQTKGEVLHQAFGRLLGQYDAYCVFDADNIVHPDFLARMNDVVSAGGRIAKSRQCALNPYDNWVSGCYDLYFENINLLHSRARAPFHLSAKLVGTGFMITDSLLQEMGGFNTVTLTEDLELAAQCAVRGVQVHYVPEALTYDEEPLSFRVSMRQRLRWSAGVQSVANRYTAKLIIKKISWLRWDMAAHINMIYVQILALIPVFYGLVQMPLPEIAKTLLASLCSFWLGSMAMALFLSLSGKRSIKKMLPAILLYPVFLLSWYPLHVWGFLKKPQWKPIVHGKTSSREGKIPVSK